jgi:hypothetical protein
VSNLVFPISAIQRNGVFAWPVKKTPSFKTIVQTPASNRGELRLSLTPYPIWKFEYGYEFLRGDYQALASAFQNLLGFFGQVGGQSQDWLFPDAYDNAVVQASGVFGYGDGATTQYQLQRQVGKMNDIIQNVNWATTPNVYVGGALQSQFSYTLGQENLLLNSQLFTLPPWYAANTGSSNPVLTGNSTFAPDGSTTATQVVFPSTVGGGINSYLYQQWNVGQSGVTFTFSVWMKCASGTQSVILQINSVNYGGESNFVVCSVTSAWTRFSLTVTFSPQAIPTNPTQLAVVYIISQNQAAQTIWVWGAQLERGPVASGYLPTTTATVAGNGVVTFDSAPTNAVQLTWAGSFYFRCRFDDDEWSSLEEFMYQLWEHKSVKFRSVIL